VTFFILAGCVSHPPSKSDYILFASLEDINEQLKGGDAGKVIDLAGEPDQHAIVVGYDAWVYVKPGSTDGRAVLFDTHGMVEEVVKY
jgi:hypothetical protein